jgi:hypothetical protein
MFMIDVYHLYCSEQTTFFLLLATKSYKETIQFFKIFINRTYRCSSVMLLFFLLLLELYSPSLGIGGLSLLPAMPTSAGH